MVVSDSGVRGLRDAATGGARDLTLADVLSGILSSARDLSGACFAALRTDRIVLDTIEIGERPPCDSQPAGHVLDVPIQAGETLAGNLYLAGKRDGRNFTDQDTAVVAALAATAGIAIENATLFERNQQRELWLSASQDVTSALLTGADHGATLRLIARRAREVASAAIAAIALPVSEDDDQLVYQVVDGPESAEVDPFRGRIVSVKGTASGKAFLSGRAVAVRDVGTDIHDWGKQAGIDLAPWVADLDSTVFAPMVVGERRLGVLMVAKFADGRPFHASETPLVQAFAGQAALVLEFARAEDDRERLAVLSDRDRIARDLHDLVVQRLFAVGLGLQGLGRLVTTPDKSERVLGLIRDIDRTIMDVRNTIFSLQDNSPGLTGLRSELLRIAHEAAGTLGVEPRIGFDGPVDSVVPSAVRPDLLATLREALSNVARHAEANRVSVEVGVDRAGSVLTLEVSDNGVGLPRELTRRGGLANMAERATRWNGTLAIHDVPGGGTQLRWSVPIGPARSGAAQGSAP